ncbi:USP [Symbiodinium sp. CCMP2592]|nr:USP [Symbiodinium sp. CCMP2592]
MHLRFLRSTLAPVDQQLSGHRPSPHKMTSEDLPTVRLGTARQSEGGTGEALISVEGGSCDKEIESQRLAKACLLRVYAKARDNVSGGAVKPKVPGPSPSQGGARLAMEEWVETQKAVWDYFFGEPTGPNYLFPEPTGPTTPAQGGARLAAEELNATGVWLRGQANQLFCSFATGTTDSLWAVAEMCKESPMLQAGAVWCSHSLVRWVSDAVCTLTPIQDLLICNASWNFIAKAHNKRPRV